MQKQEKMMDFAMSRKEAADQDIDNASAQQDQFISGAIQGGVGAFLSDIRLKENISKTGVSRSGIPIYTFSYKNDGDIWSGTMAQDLLKIGRDDAVILTSTGYYAVNYDIIDVDMELKNK
jgi:hypothetical protein